MSTSPNTNAVAREVAKQVISGRRRRSRGSDPVPARHDNAAKVRRCDPPTPANPNIYAIKSLYEVSIEVASSLVYFQSSPILESALWLAGSPHPMPMMPTPTMSPMILSRHLATPVVGATNPLHVEPAPIWLTPPQTTLSTLKTAAAAARSSERALVPL